MEHTKKFVLVDPRFVRPSMQDKVLSKLDNDISNILNSDDSDETKMKNYMTALARFKIISTPTKTEKVVPSPPPPPPPALQAPTVSFKATSPPKRPHKRVKIESTDTLPSIDPTLWRRTQRTPTKKKFGPQWLTYSDPSKKKKRSLKSWIE